MVLILHIHEIIYISLKLIIPSECEKRLAARFIIPSRAKRSCFPRASQRQRDFLFAINLLSLVCIRLVLPTSRAQFFFTSAKRGRQLCRTGLAGAVDFLCFLWQTRARERELDLLPLQKIVLSDSFWCELFVSLSPVSTRACVVAN